MRTTAARRAAARKAAGKEEEGPSHCAVSVIRRVDRFSCLIQGTRHLSIDRSVDDGGGVRVGETKTYRGWGLEGWGGGGRRCQQQGHQPAPSSPPAAVAAAALTAVEMSMRGVGSVPVNQSIDFEQRAFALACSRRDSPVLQLLHGCLNPPTKR